MSDDPKTPPSVSVPKARRVLYVANPGSDSENSGDEHHRANHNIYISPKSQSPYNRTVVASPYNDSAKYPLPPTNLPAVDTHHYPSSNPPLSSPSSSSSPAIESTPPPSTPGLSAPPLDLAVGEPPPSIQEPTIVLPTDRSEVPQVGHRNFIQKITAPFYQSTPQHNRVLPPRPTTSPTTSIADSHSSPGGQSSTSTLADKVLIVVTADSERYSTVDITSATNPAFIKERIFTKLCVWEEEDQSKFSIYQTEIGAFAIGEALTDVKLFELCRDRGDSRGSLKFLVSHSSAPVHEQLSSQSSQSSSSLSPTMTTIPPPVLPYGSRGYVPSKSRRRSRSRPGSLSSASEHLPPEVAAGYEASVSDDGDRDTRDNKDNRPVVRPPLPVPPQQPSISTGSHNVPPSPRAVRRPSGPVPRPTSPISHSFRPNSPPTIPPPLPPDRTWAQGPEPSPLRDKYGRTLPTSPPPPPSLSPNRTTFDDNSLTPPASRPLHARSASDAAAEREQALQASENQVEQAVRQWRLMEERNKQERPRDGSSTREARLRERRTGDNDEPMDKVGRSDSWVVVPRENLRETPRGLNKDQLPNSNSKELARGSPARVPHRNRDNHVSPQRYKASAYATRPLAIPSPPRNPPPPPPGVGSSEQRVPSLRQGQPVPANWTVTWKSAEKGDQKAVPTSSASWQRMPKCMDKSKSMDNLRAATANLQPGGARRPGQLPMTGPNGSTGILVVGDSRREPPALPKIYGGASSGRRPYPIAGSSQNNYESSLQAQHVARGPGLSPGLTSPSHEAYPPRPQSALGDPVTSPTQRHQRNMQSPIYASNFQEPDTVWSPRALSPTRQQFGQGFGLRRSPHTGSSPYSDAYGGIETTRMPRSPASPPDTRSREKLNDPPEPILSSISASDRADNRSGEPTLRPEDHGWITQFLDGKSAESTIIPTGPPPPQFISAHSSEMSPITPHSESSVLEDDSDSDRDCGTSIWKKPPMAEEATRPKSILRRPPLKVETQTNSTLPTTLGFPPSVQPLAPQPTSRPSALPVPAAPPVPPISRGKPGERVSRFTDMHDYTWAPRPPPEDVYEHLEEFFPNHDLDKPVIEASSGGTSPTAVEHAAIPLAPVSTPDKARVRGKKSIRIVAEEHKKRIDRNSRADLPAANVLRKRSTKLWGSRLEEVTTAQARTGFATTLPDSPSGAKPIFKWVRGELIGRGTYGRVYLALNATTGEMIAVKQVEMPRTASDKNDSRQVTVVQALKMESETLKDLDHPNIVQYLGFEETPNFLSIFLEYVPGGSIGSCLLKHGKFDEEVTKSFTAQILGGLEYLHSKGILHRDLKADNILVETSGVCKISDFGISKRTDDDAGGAHTAMQGTVFWMAPEVINTQKKGYNFKIDIWSVGCVVLEMWAGHRPWNGDEAVAVMFKLYQSKLPPPVPDDVVLSPLADDFRSKCFAINPEERPSASELRKHRYLTLSPGWTFHGFK